MGESTKHLVATCNDAYIVYDYDKERRRRIQGIKGMRSGEVILLRHPQEFAETLLKVIADCDKYNATLKNTPAARELVKDLESEGKEIT